MEIKKLYIARRYPYHMVLETLTGEMMKFYIAPIRHLAISDLTPVPYYNVQGNNAEEAPNYMYTIYGLEKAGSPLVRQLSR